jgi:hypothetical protein
MKTLLSLTLFTLIFGGSIFAQEPNRGIDQMPGKGKSMSKEEVKKSDGKDEKAKAEQANVDEKTAFPIKRGELSGTAKKVSLAKILKSPQKYAGKNVLVSGVIVRSCKMEGCWMELAPSTNAKSIRIKMKDHAFFIPLNSAGLNAKAEGVFQVKTISKDEVDHLIEDGAKFDNRNSDGSVTEVSFIAAGVELTRQNKK